MSRLLALAAVLALALGGCAGGGPLGTGLGTVVGTIAVTDGKGATCNVSVMNGKDQTGLDLEGLEVCGAKLAKLHADKSDGAAAAIAANADVTKTLGGQALALGGALAQAGIAAATGGVPVPKPPAVVPPAPAPMAEAPVAPADPLLEPGRWYEGPGGFRRYLEGVDRGAACYRTGQGAEHCASVADWRAWVRRPPAARE